MSVNVPLLRKYVEWVEEQERLTEGREWFQEEWITVDPEVSARLDDVTWCDTAFCVAGKVAIDAGWTPAAQFEDEPRYSQLVRREGCEDRHPETIAAEELGLLGMSHTLFAADNTAADIRREAERIAGERL